jgi:hypothetical protein
LSDKNRLTISYVGNNGRRLLFTQYYAAAPDGNALFANGLQFTTNASHSSYNALQIQDNGRIAKSLDMIASFTYAHALDDSSGDFAGESPLWGNSSLDLRRVLNVALNYQTHAAKSTSLTKALTHGWLVANRFSCQSGYPLDILQANAPQLNGTQVSYRPDLVPGVAIYLHGRAADVDNKPVPASWRLNPAAFALVPTDVNGVPLRQGTLGRNYIRNPSFYSLNTAAQRSFPIYEQLHLNFRVEAFNILNHPNPENPDIYLPDSTFGQLIGNIATIGSVNQLYRTGSPRSLQLSLRLEF